MGIRTTLARIAGSSAKGLLKLRGSGGTSLPGRIALRIDPGFIRHSCKGARVVLITGTNGKTLTTTLIVRILQKARRQVITNTGGANMLQGVAAAFLKRPSKTPERFYILEVDEATLKHITAEVHPEIIVFTNLFKDQTDRYADVETTFGHLLEGVTKSPDTLIIANGDLPLFHPGVLGNPVRYFGFEHAEDLAGELKEGADTLCPSCGQELLYTSHTYSNLGHYRCSHCHFRRPELSWKLEAIPQMTLAGSDFIIDGAPYHLPFSGVYNIYNALAAYAVARALGISEGPIREALAQEVKVSGRQESLQVEDKTLTLNLIKNPVGFNQIVDLLALEDKPFSLVILLNDRPADGTDVGWIEEGDFERLLELTTGRPIVLSGLRADALMARFEAAGLTSDHAVVEKDLSRLARRIVALPTEQVHVLSTYTALSDLRRQWKNQGYVKV